MEEYKLSHLKELEATGTKDNELMNDFRKQIASASPPEMVKYAGMFIKDHPESPVSVYLVRKYFIASTTPDYKQAMTYIDLMMKHQTRNGYLTRMYERVKYMEKATDLSEKMEKAESEMSSAQMAKFLKIQAKLTQAASSMY